MEHLLFILDDTRDLNWDEDEKECKKNKVFLKSIGIKSDIVGWATIDLTVHDAKEKIRLVNEYAGLHHKKMRICYTWREEYKESDWYLLEPESTNVEFEVYRMDKKNGEDEFVGIRAYKVPANIPVVAACNIKGTFAFASAQFKKSVIQHQLTGVNFVWAKDVGKYDARQYYRMIGMKECQIIYESRSYYIDKLLQKDKKRLDVLYGSNWKWLNQYEFSLELGDIDVLSIPGGEEPQVDFAACGDKMLVSSKAAKFLLEDKVLNKKQLFPCRFLKSSPFGYENIQISQCAEFRKRQVLLTGEEIQAVQKEYDNFLQQKRPKKKATLKKALQLLKEAKRNEPEYYNVPLENEICDRLKKSEYEVLLPYFKISNGMALSDEYRFLSYQEMEKETNEYKILKGLEEGISLLDGIVIAKAMDGDIVIMADKKVVRYSHEDWSVWDEWPDTETFIEEVILCL